jgi:hypothetical protein
MFDKTHRRRRQVARLAERSAVPERPWIGRGPRYLVQPQVTRACAPSLRAIADALRDETHKIDAARIASVESFLTSFDSPFRGLDPIAAGRAAATLEHEVVGDTGVSDRRTTAIAA